MNYIEFTQRRIYNILLATLFMIYADTFITIWYWSYEANTIVTDLGIENFFTIKTIMAMLLIILWYVIDEPKTKIESKAYKANVLLLIGIFVFHTLAVITNIGVISFDYSF